MIEIPEQAKALIFDLDGTVANTMQNHFTAWRKAILPYGIDFTADLFMQLTGMPRKATINKLNELYGTSMDPQVVGDIKGTHYYAIANETQPIPVVTDIVRKYHTLLPMSIGTGSTKFGAHKTLKAIGMERYFDVVITADDIVYPKPHPETFLKCSEFMGIKPEKCVVFEDGILGIQAAKEAGMMVIDINDHYKMEYSV
jgi:beta-phosphoglucomutase family hydrolase